MSLATLGAVSLTTNDLPLPDTSALSLGEALILSGGGGTTEAVVIRSIASGRNIGVTVNRGALGTLRLAHTAPTTVSAYDPSGSGGGGGVTVDNGVDPAATGVTTLNAAGADVSTPGSATLAADSFPPDPWSVDSHGTLTIQPDSVGVPCLVLKDFGGNVIAKFGQSPDYTGLPMMMDSGGDIILTMKPTGVGFVVQTTDGLNTGAGLAISPGGEIAIQADPGSGGVTIQAPATNPPFFLLRIKDAAGSSIFTVQSDGSVHIKTGTSIVADL